MNWDFVRELVDIVVFYVENVKMGVFDDFGIDIV